MAVSFAHIVKAAEPVLSVALSGPLLGIQYPLYVWASLIPIVAGCSLSAMKEVSFAWSGESRNVGLGCVGGNNSLGRAGRGGAGAIGRLNCAVQAPLRLGCVMIVTSPDTGVAHVLKAGGLWGGFDILCNHLWAYSPWRCSYRHMRAQHTLFTPRPGASGRATQSKPWAIFLPSFPSHLTLVPLGVHILGGCQINSFHAS